MLRESRHGWRLYWRAASSRTLSQDPQRTATIMAAIMGTGAHAAGAQHKLNELFVRYACSSELSTVFGLTECHCSGRVSRITCSPRLRSLGRPSALMHSIIVKIINQLFISATKRWDALHSPTNTLSDFCWNLQQGFPCAAGERAGSRPSGTTAQQHVKQLLTAVGACVAGGKGECTQHAQRRLVKACSSSSCRMRRLVRHGRPIR